MRHFLLWRSIFRCVWNICLWHHVFCIWLDTCGGKILPNIRMDTMYTIAVLIYFFHSRMDLRQETYFPPLGLLFFELPLTCPSLAPTAIGFSKICILAPITSVCLCGWVGPKFKFKTENVIFRNPMGVSCLFIYNVFQSHVNLFDTVTNSSSMGYFAPKKNPYINRFLLASWGQHNKL